eukprot:TRINITY_DN622_c0_g5_i1.p1 TRINITY_DN622_c0_g5~~TRINITY_DN622_c0_g5_i1.p1  ORF type:complete len:486 (+),score=83.70 TRINITY_DN622_c0_g5_i1:154-1611(+)
MGILGLFFILLLLIAVFRYIKWFISPLRKIPGPFAYPFVGNLLRMLSEEPGKYSMELSSKYGKVFRIFFLTTPQVVVAEPNLVKYVLNNPQIYGKKEPSYKDLAKLIGHGLVTVDDLKEHKHQRGIISNAFSYANLKSYFPIFTDKANKLALRWAPYASSGQELNVFETISLCTLEIIGRTVFATDFHCLDDDDGSEAISSGRYLSTLCKGITNFKINFSDFIFRDLNRKGALETSRKLTIEVEKIIDKKQNNENPSNQRDLLDLLLESKNEKGESLSRTEVIDNCKTFLLAGTETSSTCLSWTIWLLCQHPEIQERLHSEIFSKIGDSTPTFEQIESIPYLNNVVKESLRVRPPVGSIIRMTEQDDYLGEYFIPKGTRVFVHMNLIHNFPDFWKHPQEFNPDRWSENENEEENENNQKMLIPFILGVRSCIGSRFALFEIKAILCVLVQTYRFWMSPDHPTVKRGFGITSKLVPYLKVKIEKRK